LFRAFQFNDGRCLKITGEGLANAEGMLNQLLSPPFRHHKKIISPYPTELKQSAINQRANVRRDAKGRKPVSMDGPIFS
jgi:hypothetical protein